MGFLRNLFRRLVASQNNTWFLPVEFDIDLQRAQTGEQLFVQYGDHRGLQEAIAAWERIFISPKFSSAPLEFQMAVYNNASSIFLHRYWEQGQATDLNRAIEMSQIAVQGTPIYSSDLPSYLNNLGNGLRARYARTGQLADLQKAIQATQTAVQYTPPDSPNLIAYLNNLGNGLRTRYTCTGQLSDLQEANRAYKSAIKHISPSSYDIYSRSFYNLGIGLRDLYNLTNQMPDLEEAVRVTKIAVQHIPRHSPERPSYLNGLGLALLDRYICAGQLSDLEEAICVFQTSVQLTSTHSPDLPSHLNSLGNGLSHRYDRVGQLSDLEETIRTYEMVVKLTAPNSPDLTSRLNNWAGSLLERYWRMKQLPDLTEVIRITQMAVQRTPSSSPDLPRSLHLLGNSLYAIFARTNQLSHLKEALNSWEKAVQLISSDSSYELSIYLCSMGNGLLTLYTQTEQVRDLEEGIRVTQMALQCTSPDSPYLSSRLNILGRALQDRYDCIGKLADLEEAINVWRDACQRGLKGNRGTGLIAARNWGYSALERHSWKEANEAYAFGLVALEQLYKAQALRQDRQSWQKDAPDLVINATYALARDGKLEQAVLVLEQGRARGLHESLARDQADLRALQQEAPALFAAYQEAAGRLHQLEAVERHQQIGWESNTPPPDWSAHRKQVAEVTQRLDEAIARIRQLPNYTTFLTPPDFATVTAAVQPDTPLLYLLTTAVGSLGLLVQQAPRTSTETVTITPIWADTFTEVDLNTFLIQRNDGQVTGGYLPGQLGQSAWLKASLANGLPQLGEKLMAPIAARLHDLDPDLKQVTLIPTGHLSLLPLHAAHYLQDGQETTFIDRFTVSYTPSAQTLAHSQQKLAQKGADELPWLLAVGNPLPSKASSLPFARLEAEEIANFFPGQAHLFSETTARYEAVTAHLPQAVYLHLSCHGIFDTEQPLASGLLLSDDRLLTLADILDQFSLPEARLVVLSACQTAVTDFQNVPDEVVGLPAGFLQAGVPGVVGSLWSVNDLSTMLLMRRFYELHMAEETPLPPAEALRQAQLWLKGVTSDELFDLFEELKEIALDRPQESLLRMPYGEALILRDKYIFEAEARGKDWKPFAHPYYWAAFTFSGT